ncbi:MAG: hypothetical protein Q9171_003621 [Xanthocarpia ochracea]
MALKSPLMPSPNTNPISAFSPYTDSPSSPAPFKSLRSSGSSGNSNYLQPPPQSPLVSSPSDIADPSPIAPSSNGTDFDETALELEVETSEARPEPRRRSTETTPLLRQGEPELKLDTGYATANSLRPRSDEDEQPTSVIHAPQGFEAFHSRSSPPSIRCSTPTPSHRSDITAIGLPTADEIHTKQIYTQASPPPIDTAVPPAKNRSSTPVAQKRPQPETETSQETIKLPRASSLEDIPEAQDGEQTDDQTPDQHSNDDNIFDEAIGHFQHTTDEVAALKLALSECWTLCNTLASLSYIHRERSYGHNRKGDVQGKAWKSCWKLCQKLYDTRDEDDDITQVRPTLDLCRDFCQCLFVVRQKENETADSDSVLRVSFELNNHLYNTYDRTLPEAYRERTLNFYITLCHRLMKQRSGLAADTDLGACWSLAEMLFDLRQNKREGKPADEELLGSAVQACWELCDLFREGWTQVRPDRGTPRPSQTTFTQAFQQAKQSSLSSNSPGAPPYAYADLDEYSDDDLGRANPETPTTVFEDTQQMSPEEAPVPNILVLGPNARSQQQSRNNQHRNRGIQQKWSSSSSTLSGYSGSSTSTLTSEDPQLLCLKIILVKAAISVGYQRSSSVSLQSFIKSIPSNSFGNERWQLQLLHQYKKLVTSDTAFKQPGPARRAAASDIARAVRWMVGTGQYIWLEDLFRLIFGFRVQEGEMRTDVFVQT